MKCILYLVGNLAFLIGLTCLPTETYSQRVFEVKYPTQADFTYHVVKHPQQADVLIYKTKFQAEAKNLSWWFANLETLSDFSIYKTKHPNQADLKIYFVKYRHQVKWNNPSKTHFLHGTNRINYRR